MGSPLSFDIPIEKEGMEEGEAVLLSGEALNQKEAPKEGVWALLRTPLNWFSMLSGELHWSFVFGVVVVYGVCQGLGGSIAEVASGYYWKDVQMVQPSESQVYNGITFIPWMVKPLWGILTDVLPMAGYHRRPYFILAGLLGVTSMLTISLHNKLHAVFALLAMAARSAGAAIADVTVDACVAKNSISHPSLAADMQTLCRLSESIGGLLGFSVSGLLVHAIGSQGALGSLSVPSALVLSVGIILKELHIPDFDYNLIFHKFIQATRTMWTTLKCPDVWRPCVYMYVSIALSLNIQEGMFYWYTDPNSGPSFSQETIGFVSAFGSIGSLLGVLIYQNIMKDYPFRSLLFWSHLLSSFSGMLDLILILRLNLKLGIPDYSFVAINRCVCRTIGSVKWLTIFVLSSKLCPSGIEGTFFALLMSIDNFGELTASWVGGLLLHMLKVTRQNFSSLWAVVLIRNIMRLLPLALLYLIPKSNQHSIILTADILLGDDDMGAQEAEVDDVELTRLVGNS